MALSVVLEEQGEELVVRSLDPSAQLVMSASARHRAERVQMMLAASPSWLRVPSALMRSALKFCDVASGRADVYPRISLLEWVLAAGDALVRAAGGSVTTLEGAPVRYNQWDSLKAPKFVAAGDSDINYLELIPDPDL